MTDTKKLIEHLRRRFLQSQRTPVLFTGAGFSCSARDRAGRPLPVGTQLASELWEHFYAPEPFDGRSSLRDIFASLMPARKSALRSFLVSRFTVDPSTLPSFYRTYFALPWSRLYTLNIDDLDLAASTAFTLTRSPVPISGTTPPRDSPLSASGAVLLYDSIHLNGLLADAPDHVIFSTLQYAEHNPQRDEWYSRLVGDFSAHPFVFVGTPLDEDAIWENISLRSSKGGYGTREHRPTSFLVSPGLTAARRELLAQYNVRWLPMDAQAFAEQVLAPVLEGIATALQSGPAAPATAEASIPLVQDLVAERPTADSYFLLGHEPIWADIVTQRAAPRSIDEQLVSKVRDCLEGRVPPTAFVLNGTAGSGKSTTLMSAAYRLFSGGALVRFVDRDASIPLRTLRSASDRAGPPEVLFIDDAHRFGLELSSAIRALLKGPVVRAVVVGLRSTRVGRHLNPAHLEQIAYEELPMPPLEDADIEAILDTLERHHSLGVLDGRPRAQQVEAFRLVAERQLLVAMYEATSGEKFEERVYEEFSDLEGVEKSVYGILALANEQGFKLTEPEVVMCMETPPNEALVAIATLRRRRLIGIDHPSTHGHRLRHKVVAEVLAKELRESGECGYAVKALASLGIILRTTNPRDVRAVRLLTRFISHMYLPKAIGIPEARRLYREFEDRLAWDHHFWLQRGALEVQEDDVNAAEMFLNTAKAKSPRRDDQLVRTEWAHLLFRKAILAPRSERAGALVEEAAGILQEEIRRRGLVEPYPYHILVSQGLAWIHRAPLSQQQRSNWLKRLSDIIIAARKRFPSHEMIAKLQQDINDEISRRIP